MNIPSGLATASKSTDLVTSPAVHLTKRPSWKLMGLALVVAGISDVLALAVTFVLPAQLAIDMSTALLLFLILGRRWAILPGLVAEAIPGMGIFPVWILVVLSIIFYDDVIKKPRKID